MTRLLIALLMCLPSFGATTYYVDYVTGNDANSGTSKVAPWKHGPSMRAFTGTYTHQAGDRIIYKGNVTWPNQTLQYRVIYGGTSGNPDYHGVDQTWYTGGAWGSPVFDCELKPVTNYMGRTSNQNGAGILFDSLASGNQVNNIIMDGILIKRHWGSLNSAGTSFGRTSVLLYGTATTNIVLTNMWIGDWNLPPVTPGQDSGNGGGVAFKDTGSTGGKYFVMTGCYVTTQGASQKTGTGLKINGTLTNCVLSYLTSTYLGGGSLLNNFAYEIGLPATDPNAHENGFYIQTLTTAVGNVISNYYAQGFYEESGCFRKATSTHWNTNTGVGTSFYKNNVIIGKSSAFGAAFDLDLENLPGGTAGGVSNTAVVLIGNTVYRPSASPAITMTSQVQRPGQKLGLLWMADNHIINNSGGSAAVNLPSSSLLTPLVAFNNVTQSVATATSQGFTVANLLQPTSDTTALYRTGSELTVFPFSLTVDRLGVVRSTPPDVGCYQYGVTPPPPPRILRATLARVGTLRVLNNE